MTRKALIELVKRRLKYSDDTGQFSLPYIEGVMDTVWQELCTMVYDNSAQDINYYSKLFAAQPIIIDVDNHLYHIDLPDEMIRLPRVGEGVISVNQLDSRSADFKPVTELNFRLMTSQEVFRIGSDIYYYVKSNKIFFGESLTTNIINEGVDVYMCVKFSSYDLNEQLPLPAGQSQTFIQKTVEYLIGTPPVNKNNKNEV